MWGIVEARDRSGPDGKQSNMERRKETNGVQGNVKDSRQMRSKGGKCRRTGRGHEGHVWNKRLQEGECE